MSEYGQSIPAKVFREFTFLSLTRQAFFNRICRMMEAVGMVYLESMEIGRRDMTILSNLLDPANAELWRNSSSDSRLLVAFDYPTSETFTVGGIAYRPFIFISLEVESSGCVSGVYEPRQVVIQRAVRPATAAFAYGDCFTYHWARGRTAFGGFLSLDNTSSAYGITEQYGLGALKDNWKIAAADTGTPSAQTLSATHWFAYLGPAGLVVSVGTADASGLQDKSALFNVMNAIFLFGGARIPNRGRTPVLDTNLNRIEPVVCIPGYDTNSTYHLRSTGEAVTQLLVMGHDLKSTVATGRQAVFLSLRNLDNIDNLPVGGNNVQFQLRPVPSPRAVNGVGRHVLSRLVVIPQTGLTTAGLVGTYAPVDDDYGTQLSTWADVFTTPSARLTDNRAPIGLYTDPDTSVPWWLHYINAYDCGLALHAAGLTQITTLPTRSYGAATASAYTVAGPLPAVTTLGQIGTAPAAMWAYLQYVSGTQGQFTLGSNSLDSTVTTASTSEPAVTVEFDLPPGGSLADRYLLQFDASVQGGTESSASMGLRVQLFDMFSAGWVTVATYAPAGANTGHANFNYATRAAVALRISPPSPAALTTLTGTRLTVRFTNRRNTSGGTNLVTRVGNFVLQRSRWQ